MLSLVTCRLSACLLHPPRKAAAERETSKCCAACCPCCCCCCHTPEARRRSRGGGRRHSLRRVPRGSRPSILPQAARIIGILAHARPRGCARPTWTRRRRREGRDRTQNPSHRRVSSHGTSRAADSPLSSRRALAPPCPMACLQLARCGRGWSPTSPREDFVPGWRSPRACIWADCSPQPLRSSSAAHGRTEGVALVCAAALVCWWRRMWTWTPGQGEARRRAGREREDERGRSERVPVHAHELRCVVRDRRGGIGDRAADHSRSRRPALHNVCDCYRRS